MLSPRQAPLRYQDYVIKGGCLIGRFEDMYRDCADPWHQAAPGYNGFSRAAAILNMRRYKVRSLVEFGCGLGYFASAIAAQTGIAVVGVDVSRTAVAKARSLWPDLKFQQDTVESVGRYADYDAVLFAELTWYVLPRLDVVFETMLERLPGKLFLHNLVFYKDGRQTYGRDYFTSLDEFIARTPFRLLGRAEATSVDVDTIETSCVFRIERRR